MSQKRSKKNLWKIIPSRDPEDQLYNRRLMAYFSLAYCAIWFQQILLLIAFGLWLEVPLDAASITALLGVPTSLSGLGFWKYLEACRKDDNKKIPPKEEGS